MITKQQPSLTFVEKIWRILEGIEDAFRYFLLKEKKFMFGELYFKNEPAIIRWMNKMVRKDAISGNLNDEETLKALKHHPKDILLIENQVRFVEQHNSLLVELPIEKIICYKEHNLCNFQEALTIGIKKDPEKFLECATSTEVINGCFTCSETAIGALKRLSPERLGSVNEVLNSHVSFEKLLTIKDKQLVEFIIQKMYGKICFLAILSRFDVVSEMCADDEVTLRKVKNILELYYPEVQEFNFPEFNKEVEKLLNKVETDDKYFGILRAMLFTGVLKKSHISKVIFENPYTPHTKMVKTITTLVTGDYQDFLSIKKGNYKVEKVPLCDEVRELFTGEEAIDYVALGGSLLDDEIIALVENGYPLDRIEEILGQGREISPSLRNFLVKKKIQNNSYNPVEGLCSEAFKLLCLMDNL